MINKSWSFARGGIILLAPGLLFVLALGSVTAAPSTDATRGKTVWATSPCAGCHGENGEGVSGPRLAATALSAELWITQVRTPRNRMPAFTAAQVSDQDIRDMNDFMKTLAAPGAVAATPASKTSPTTGAPAAASPTVEAITTPVATTDSGLPVVTIGLVTLALLIGAYAIRRLGKER